MTGEKRREMILQLLRESSVPLSGGQLARRLGVSRQVIVQDIALLRAGEAEILSTPKGYLCGEERSALRIFQVFHTEGETEDELNIIVDHGGTAVDVFVRHGVYGELHAQLGLRSRSQVAAFCEELRAGRGSPLMNVTSGLHFHTVRAHSEAELDQIEAALEARGYLRR